MGYMLDMAKDTQYPVRKLAYFSDAMAEAIATFRHDNRIASENEAIRRLINMGIAAEPILRDLLRLIEHLNDPELAKHEKSIREALGE